MMRSVLFLSFVILYILIIVHCQGSEQAWKKKEKSLRILDMAKDSITKANDHLTIIDHCDKSENESSGCEDVKKTLFYLEVATTLISTVKEKFQKEAEVKSGQPIDCTDILRGGNAMSGVYTIWPRNLSPDRSPIPVYCDMDSDGGGWTVVQRRGNYIPQEDFYRDWNDYKEGFGNLRKDFWLGNDNLHYLSNQRKYKILFNLESKEGEKAFALYKTFFVEDEKKNYKLHIANYSGTAGSSMNHHNGMLFSTKDRDNDKWILSCAQRGRGGWWYNICSESNPNGEYNPGVEDAYKSIHWYYWKKDVGLASTEIKIKAVQNLK